MSLATLEVDNVTMDKFDALVASAISEFRGHFSKGLNGNVYAGVIQDHGCTVDYVYDSDQNLLTFDVMSLGRIYFHKISVDELKTHIIGWIEETIAAMPHNPVGETVPKPETVVNVPSTVTAPDVQSLQPETQTVQVVSEAKTTETSNSATEVSNLTQQSEVQKEQK